MRLATVSSAGTQDPQRSAFREVPWRWRDVLVGLAPLVAARGAMALMARMDPSSLPAAPRWLWLPLSLLAMAWMLVYPLRAAHLRLAETVPPLRPRAVLVEFLVALVALPIVMVALGVTSRVTAYLPGAAMSRGAAVEPFARSLPRVEFLAFLILAVSVSPVVEEVFFRGLLYNALRQRLPWLAAAVLQAVAFGLLHPFDLANAALVAVAGLAFAVVYEWRRTLLTPILLHALLSAVSLAVLAWGIAADAAVPRLGVRGEPHEGGCRIMEVVPGGAADAAGLRVGDVVTALDWEPVADFQSLVRAVRRRRVGDRVTIEFTRGQAPHRAEAVLRGPDR